MRTITKRLAVLGATTALAVGGGIAYASWLASGSGDATAQAGSATALTVSEATASAALVPGGDADLVFTVGNGNPYPVNLTAASLTNLRATPATNKTCTVATSGVTSIATVPAPTGGWAVGPGGNLKITLPKALHMSNSSDDGCQGATFTVAVTITGQSAATS
jgi:hypothetical protein